MVNIAKSFEARVTNPLLEKYYSITADGRKIRNFKNKYLGKRCFLIGNGPSLRAEDLTELYNHNEITFGFNRIYNIYDQTNWRPTFYISQDEKILKGCVKEVNGLSSSIKLIPVQFKWYHDLVINDAVYFNYSYENKIELNNMKFSDDVSRKVHSSNTGMYTAAQFAAYMGFTDIYMIGVDHHFHTSRNNKGEIVIDNTVKDYFSEKYNNDKKDLYIPNTELSTVTYMEMKRHCDEKNIHVYNATRGGKLEVFPRVYFDNLF